MTNNIQDNIDRARKSWEGVEDADKWLAETSRPMDNQERPVEATANNDQPVSEQENL